MRKDSERRMTSLRSGEAKVDARAISVKPACATAVSATKSPKLLPIATTVNPRIANNERHSNKEMQRERKEGKKANANEND